MTSSAKDLEGDYPRRFRRDRGWDDDNVHPTKGPNHPAEFLKENFKLSATGSVFRTVKAKFPPKVIHAEAKKARVTVFIKDEDPWLKVTVIGKLPPLPPKPSRKTDFYTGASVGKQYSPVTQKPAPVAPKPAAPKPTSTSDPAIDIFS
jgi:hypothetical protein